MTRTQKWSAGTAAVVLLLLVAGWLLLVSPKRAEADTLHAQAANQQQQNAQLSTQIAQLKAQQQQLPAKQAELATIRQQIPQTPALPGLVRSLASIAKDTGVEVTNLAPAPPAKPVVGTGTAVTATVKGPDGSELQVIGVTIELSGSYYNVERFLSRLETLKRSVLVTGFTMVQATGGSSAGVAVSATPSVGVSPVLKVDVNARVFMSAVPPADPTAAPATATAAK